MNTWTLRFDPQEITYWAKQCLRTRSEAMGIEQIRQRTKHAGYYTLEDFLTVVRWKTNGRSEHWARQNAPDDVVTKTRIALTTSVGEEERIGALLSLKGVQYPVASALLHVGHADRYPILDYHALASLGVQKRGSYDFEFWMCYVRTCRDLAKRYNVDMLTLDSALWQYDKENPLKDRL